MLGPCLVQAPSKCTGILHSRSVSLLFNVQVIREAIRPNQGQAENARHQKEPGTRARNTSREYRVCQPHAPIRTPCRF